MSKPKTISFVATTEMYNVLVAEATNQDRTVSSLLRRIINLYLDSRTNTSQQRQDLIEAGQLELSNISPPKMGEM